MLRASILGGVDGVITSFAVVAGASAGGLGKDAVWVVGASSVLADGLSMGVSEFLSSSAEQARGVASSTASPSPTILGLACFASFVVCGAVPVLLFLATQGAVLACACFSLVELMLLGVARTQFTKEALWRGVLQTSLLGAAAGGVAYGVGAWIRVVE